MADMRTFETEFVCEFIDIYKSFPCLWKIKSNDYCNRIKKNVAYGHLVKKLQERIPYADKETVVKKLDSLRGTFRKEWKKVNESKKSASGTDQVYVPRLRYYENLLFLKDSEIPQPSVNSNFDTSTSGQDDSLTHDEVDASQFSSRGSSPHLFAFTPNTESDATFDRSVCKKRKNTSLCEGVLEEVNKKHDFVSSDDDFDTFAKHLANKLRRLPREVEITTEKLILDVVYQAELGEISRNTKMQLFETPSQRVIYSNAVNNPPITVDTGSSPAHMSPVFYRGNSVRMDADDDDSSNFIAKFEPND